jgi:hypothetical protein
MAEFKLGRLKFWWKGEWQTGHAYVKDDVVRFGGKSYVCIGSHNSGINDESFYTALETAPFKWELMTDGIQWQGEWTTGTYYKEGDVVKFGSDTYICVDGNTASADFMADQDAGNWENFVNGVELEGDWNSSHNYQVGDIVRLGGNTFIAKRDNTNAKPTVSTDDWGVFVHGLKWKGQYAPTTTYFPGDVVKEGSSSYVAIVETIGTAPSTDLANTTWNAVAEGDTSDVLTTTGDIAVYGTTNIQRLPAGAGNAVLQIDAVSGVPAWKQDVEIAGDLMVQGDAHVVQGDVYQGPNAQDYTQDVDIFDVTSEITSVTKSATQVFIYYAVGSALANANGGYHIDMSGVADPNTLMNSSFSVDSNNTTNRVITITVAGLTGTGTVNLTGATVSLYGPNAYAGMTDASGVFVGNADSFVQFALKNTNNGTGASTDLIVYADNGDNSSGWMDMGITSSQFDNPDFTVTGPNDGYIFMSAPTGTAGKGDLILGTGDGGQHNDIVMFTGGFDAANVKMRLIGTARPEISESTGMPTGRTIEPGVEVYLTSVAENWDEGALRVVGGLGVQGNIITKGDLRAEMGVICQGSNAKKLTEDDYVYPGYVGLTNPSAIMTGNANSFVQMSLKNFSTGDLASTDLILYSSAGDNNSGWIDMGICSENYDDPSFGVTGPGDGYIFMSAKEGSTTELGNLYVSTSSNGVQNDIVFSTGGFEDSSYERMRIIGSARPGKQAGVEIYSSTNSTSTTTGALRVNGGIGLQGNLNVGGDVNINGNTTIQGTIVIAGGSTTVTSQNLAVQDPMIFCADGNSADIVDMGVVGSYRLAPDSYTSVDLVGATFAAAGETLYITKTAHGATNLDRMTISSANKTEYNGTYETITIVDANTITVQKIGATWNGPVTATATLGVFVNGLRYAGLVRDHVDGRFKLFTAYQVSNKPTTVINQTDAQDAFLELGAIKVTNTTASSSYTTGAVIVSGGVGVSGAMYVQNALYCGSDITAWYSSDSRLKDNVKPIEGALDKISKIGGYEFDWNATAKEQFPDRETHDIGVIAQEIQAVQPEVVVERDNGYLAVNYEKLVPLLIQGIKELQEEVKALRAKIGE